MVQFSDFQDFDFKKKSTLITCFKKIIINT